MIDKHGPLSGPRFWREFHAGGCIHAAAVSSISASLEHPAAWIGQMMGTVPVKVRTERVPRPREPEGGLPDAGTGFTTAASSHFPPHMQVFVVPPDSESRLEIEILDSWTLLREAETRSVDFYRNLFDRIRMMRFEKSVFIAPTFSTITGRLIFSHPPILGERDKIGERVTHWMANRDPHRVELCAGEVLVIDNHRFAKRTRLLGPINGVHAYAIWTDRETNQPEEKHLELARSFKQRLAHVFPSEDVATMLRFGLLDRPLEEYLQSVQQAFSQLETVRTVYRQVFEALCTDR
jgi:hypothetical protein